MAVGRESSPSEQTPLISSSRPDDELIATVSIPRGIAIAAFMEMLILIQTINISMMTTAQSDIAADLDAFDQATWFTSAYLIAASSVTPLTGRLAEIFTPRLYVIFASTTLAIGLFITAAAPTLAVFLLGRAVAGVGSGGLMSIAIILVVDLASPKRRGLCIGMINAGYTTGLASGAVLAGLMTSSLGWRLIFWIQAPAALVLGPLLFLAIPASSGGRAPLNARSILRSLARVDYAGALALTLSVVLLLSSLASPEILIWPLPLSAVCFVIFVFIESRWTTNPVIPVRLLQSRSVLMSCLAGLGLMMARWAVLFYTPVYAMAVRGWSPATAGLILVPTNAGFGTGGLLVGWLHIRRSTSYYASCLVIFVLFAVATSALSVLSTPNSPTWLYVVTTFLNGLFAGSLMNYTLSHVLHLTSPHVHYIVSSLIAMSRGFAGSFGSAVGGGFFTRILKASLEDGFAQHDLPSRPDLIRTLLGSPATVMRLTGPEQVVAIQSYEHAIRMLFLGGSLVALTATAFQAATGWTSEVDSKSDPEREV
ncbi:MFS multidrug transporter [Penicillium brasilianum]|uniref:MFS multidrug transporter n=1 Tax=Penicillium brasilianum TaxID=104259 RepID=A0A1S9RGZ3_PENBI|nr:MFS multidrug transporter [Penicillium brasilianum]